MFLFSVPTMALTSFLSSLLSYVVPTFFNLCISAVVSIGLFTLLCVMFNVINFSLYVVKFKEKFGVKIKKMSKKRAKIAKKIK